MAAPADAKPSVAALEPTVDAIVAAVGDAAVLYHRLVLVVGTVSEPNSAALAAAAERMAAPLLNVGLDLSRELTELSARQRRLQVVPMLERHIAAVAGQRDTVLLDRTELLFEPSLRQDPLRLLQGLSRNRTVVAAWTGTLGAGALCYAAPGHPEHQRSPANGLLIVRVATGSEA